MVKLVSKVYVGRFHYKNSLGYKYVGFDYFYLERVKQKKNINDDDDVYLILSRPINPTKNA